VSLSEPVVAGRTVWSSAGHGEIAALVDLDPDLADALPADRRTAAQRDVLVRVVRLERGPWAIERLTVHTPADLGLLVVDGLVGRELLAHNVASMELVGPGDVVRPWDEGAGSQLLEAVVRWSALAETRFAILDRHVAARLARYPELYGALLERCVARTRRLAVLQAISHITRVDRRLLALLWHLAERWGRVTPDGVAVPLVLSHRMLGQLVGARRPTVSTSLAELTRAGELTRGPGGTWILTGSPVGAPDERTARFVAPRRPTLAELRQDLPA
jgi:CRP/FNR family cyclic AMP-dependent transcriptional regulator